MRFIFVLAFCLSAGAPARASAENCETFLQKTSRVLRNYSLVDVLPYGVDVTPSEMDEFDFQFIQHSRWSRQEFLMMELVDSSGRVLLATKIYDGRNGSVSKDLVMDSATAILLKAGELGLTPAALVVRHNHPFGHLPGFSAQDKAVSRGLKFLLEEMGFPDTALTMRLIYYPSWNARAKEFTIPSFYAATGDYRVRGRQRKIVCAWLADLAKHRAESAAFKKISSELIY
jgi:hypothetical protein